MIDLRINKTPPPPPKLKDLDAEGLKMRARLYRSEGLKRKLGAVRAEYKRRFRS